MKCAHDLEVGDEGGIRVGDGGDGGTSDWEDEGSRTEKAKEGVGDGSSRGYG